MLRLKSITKNYKIANGEVPALKGIDICFRKNEFVSILGPSGCGKTTMLNIVGGLDKYTSGDLIIQGKSTKDFTDRDWDTYRNQRIGFIFQSYNLIPHQTVLGNVELALTISGISKEERVKRSKKALERVGLKGEEYKRPNQLSGGQCQRVAIARALVNEPDILLADEPTGALDSKTSVQIMELIKEISKDKLVIMVTHNAEIAEQYSSRIVKLVDGEIISDNNPFSEEQEIKEIEQDAKPLVVKKKKQRKSKMSFWTAFKLSLRNLFTKRGRTALTSFAGSIGIIGISLILAVSQGTTAYINHVQETTLSSYPLTIEEQTMDLTSLMESFMNVGNGEVTHDKDGVYKAPIIAELVNALAKVQTSENDLRAFKSFIEQEMNDEGSELYSAVTGVQYTYNLQLDVYTKNIDGNIVKSDAEELMMDMLGKFMVGISSGGSSNGQQGSSGSFDANGMSNMNMFGNSMNTGTWQELLSSPDGAVINDLIYNQYDLVHGDWPKAYNEIVLVLDKNNELDDLTLYALGLIGEEEIDAIIDAAVQGKELENNEKKWTYKEVCEREFKTILPYDRYVSDGNGGFVDVSEFDVGFLYDTKGLDLKVTGIIRENPDAETHMLKGSICYTYKLTEYIINQAKNSDVVKAQLQSLDVDVITGKPFKATTGKLTEQQKATAFVDYVNKLALNQKAQKYVEIMSIIPQETLIAQLMESMKHYPDRASQEGLIATAIATQMGLNESQIKVYLQEMSDQDVKNYSMMVISMGLQEKYAMEKAQEYAGQLLTDPQGLATALDQLIASSSQAVLAGFYDNVTEFADLSYEENLEMMGCLDLDSPNSINIYTSSFANKDIIVKVIKEYNADKEEVNQIKYTDYVGILMSSITTIIDAITYVLIAFVSIALIVSSIMIAVITLISVQERTKEIGILRAIGASKRDVSSMFNAETVIIGLISGLTGVMFTYILCLPINLILNLLTGLNTLNAILPIGAAGILVGISVVLNLFSGLIPSRAAAKKDPVVALRTE